MQPKGMAKSLANHPFAALDRDRTKASVAAMLSEAQLEKTAAMVDKKGRQDKGPIQSSGLVEVDFELSQWHTEYQDQRDADSIRAQTSLIYKF